MKKIKETVFRSMIAAALLSVSAVWPTASSAADYGFSVGDKLPVYTYHGADGVKHRTSDLQGRWFLFKRGADWCLPCVAERPGVDAFMKAHPEVPVVMAVTSPKGSTDLETLMQKDVALQQRKGFRSDIVSAIDQREPSQSQVPTPQAVTDIPLTIVVDPNGVIAGLWNSTYAYQHFYSDRGIGGKPAPEFRDYVEAVMVCRGAKVTGTTRAASDIAVAFGPTCS